MREPLRECLQKPWRVSAKPQMTDSQAKTRKPDEVYDGGHAESQGVRLRIANGGAGQIGLIRALADKFIEYMVLKKEKPFKVAWYKGDTTESLELLSSGTVDVALTYNPAAEQRLVDSGDAVQRVLVYNDHFILAGPKSNPARLEMKDDIFTMFYKIVTRGDADIITPPTDRLPQTRFLSRFDKSATNIKESQIFISIGQVPWALNYSKWYHQYQQYPFEALLAAAQLSEYTLTDGRIWASVKKSFPEILSRLEVFKIGSDDPKDPLLSPAHALRRKQTSDIHIEFMSWVVSPTGGQKVIKEFSDFGITPRIKLKFTFDS